MSTTTTRIIRGRAGSGKTTEALAAALLEVREGRQVVWLDCADTLRPNFLDFRGWTEKDTLGLSIIPVGSFTELIGVIDTHPEAFVVVDDFGALRASLSDGLAFSMRVLLKLIAVPRNMVITIQARPGQG